MKKTGRTIDVSYITVISLTKSPRNISIYAYAHINVIQLNEFVPNLLDNFE